VAAVFADGIEEIVAEEARISFLARMKRQVIEAAAKQLTTRRGQLA
jgi:hypothetical protein